MLKVLVALDHSPVSLRAAREASRLFPDAQFLVVNVTRRITPWVGGGGFGVVYPMVPLDLPPQGPDDDEVGAWADEASLEDAEILNVEGDPALVICEAAHTHDVDVVVVGSHDKGVLRRLLDPSIAQAVVQGTYKPVLVVSGIPPAE